MERIFDICHGCRRCVSLCQSFPTLFDLVDASETMEVDGVDRKDYMKVVDQCYLCDLCYLTKCPYVPPHEWNLDFPHVMLRAKAIAFKKGTETQFRDVQLASTDRNGKLAGIPVVEPYQATAYRQKLRATDIFLFPSLRDNCPISLLEAMGHGCVPVVADHAGPGEIVTPECGIKIPLTRPAEFVDRLAEELAGLFQDADRRRRLGEAARLRVIENFSQEHWLQRVEAAYQKVTAGTRPS